MKHVLSVLIFVLLSLGAWAQKDSLIKNPYIRMPEQYALPQDDANGSYNANIAKNEITVQASSFILFNMLSVKYSRTLFHFGICRLTASVGFGGLSFLDLGGGAVNYWTIPMAMNLITGKHDNHFEVNLGY